MLPKLNVREMKHVPCMEIFVNELRSLIPPEAESLSKESTGLRPAFYARIISLTSELDASLATFK
jgi:hypothetical protein